MISANIPLRDLIGWFAGLQTDLVIEFVTKDDSMVQKLLRQKRDNYADYDRPAFHRRPRAVGEDVRADAASDDSYLDIPAFLRKQAD